MENNNKIKTNHVYGFSKLKAILLAGTMTLGLGACGRTIESTPGTNVSIETQTNTGNTKENKENVTTTVTPANPQTSVYYPDNNTTQYTEVIPADVQTSVYYPSTENSTYTINPSQPQTSVHQPVSGNKTTTIKNNDIKVTTTKTNTQRPTTTKKVTTAKPTTTQKVTTTTVRVTQPPVTTVPYIKRTYNKYDILSDDPYEAKFALSQLANQLGAELYNGYNPVNQYGFLLAEAAAYAIIVDLNYNQGINIKALGDAYGLQPEDEFLSDCDNLNLAHYQYFYGSKVDWTKYVLDENLANFINTVSDEYKEYMNGNTEPLMNEINNYFANNSIDIDNYAKYYFMCNTKNPEDYYCDEMNEGREIFTNNVTKPLYDEICQNKVILQIRG